MICVSLLAVAGFLAVDAKSDVARRLQEEQLLKLRRRNAWDDIEDMFIDMGDFFVDVGDVFVDGWEEVEEFFTEDMVQWFEEDFANFWIEFGDANEEMFEDFGEWTAEVFTEGWDTVVYGLEEAWEWTEDAAVTAWEETEELFEKFECMVENWTGAKCIQCIEDSCNATLDQKTIDQIDTANSYAIMDMENAFDPLFEGCAAAIGNCPAVSDCEELNNLPESTKAYVANTIAQCNLCYQCLPYGSTKETCQKALDQVMPNECEGCSESQSTMYKMFYSCSGIKAIHDGLTLLGESYAEGASAHEALDAMCEYCPYCSDYQEELKTTCSDWATISSGENGWDCEPPVVPDALVLEGTLVGVTPEEDGSTSGSDPVPSPTQSPPVESDDDSTSGSDPVSSPTQRPPVEASPTQRPTRTRPTQKPTKPPTVNQPSGGNRPNGGGSTRPGGRGRRLRA